MGLAIFTISSLVCRLSNTPLMLNIARAVQNRAGCTEEWVYTKRA